MADYEDSNNDVNEHKKEEEEKQEEDEVEQKQEQEEEEKEETMIRGWMKKNCEAVYRTRTPYSLTQNFLESYIYFSYRKLLFCLFFDIPVVVKYGLSQLGRNIN